MELLALALVFLPALAAIGIAVSGLRSERALGAAAIAVTGVMLAFMLAAVRFGGDRIITVPIMNLSFCFDGFRKLYGTVVCSRRSISAITTTCGGTISSSCSVSASRRAFFSPPTSTRRSSSSS